MNNAPFRVGQRVVCVDSKLSSGMLNDGDVYVIKRGNYYYDRFVCVDLVGLNGPWQASRFAPIPPRSIEIPESLKEQAEEMKDLAETIAPMKKELV